MLKTEGEGKKTGKKEGKEEEEEKKKVNTKMNTIFLLLRHAREAAQNI